ncbi:MAG: glucosyltransferase domain-containing protein [Peptostreptococcus sp.]|uniref:glucosyltransferase domain-containing protein n=1 Tax=Peptostreptococcus TaxID=1257 RepID=UPI000766FEC4|nr:MULTISPECIES: glucosyltransferase domain-containing protein [Peptostreptococcus]KXB68712.1 hypothetical protein HMPREF3183_01816 [Peptostreptococcus anaerobius]MDU1265186.1 glucosyltransferase domain-containing protein [Peptostreptococcus sp.]
MNYEKLKRKCYYMWIEYRIVFFTTFVLGVISHGMALFNKISLQDDPESLFYVGQTYTSGRWGLGILWKLVRIFTGTSSVSIPLTHGLISFLLLSISSILILKSLNIKSKFSRIAISGLMVTFPAFTALVGYNFTMPYYCVAVLLSILGVTLICANKSILYTLTGIIFIAFGLGIYQAYFAFSTGLLILVFLNELIGNTVDSNGKWFLTCFKKTVYTGSGVIVYFIINKIFLNALNQELSNYRSISTFGVTSIGGYVDRIGKIYQIILNGFIHKANNPEFEIFTKSTNMFPFSLRYLYLIILYSTLFFSIYICIKLFRKDLVKLLYCIILLTIYPMMILLSFLMTETDFVHSLMVYPSVMILFLPLLLIERIQEGSTEIKGIRKMYKSIVFVSISFMLVFNSRYANIAHLKGIVQQEQCISYYTTLISQIKSVKGYKNGMKVCFVERDDNSVNDSSIGYFYQFSDIGIIPYEVDSYIKHHKTYKHHMRIWCGFNPEYVDSKVFIQNNKVKMMSHYPDEGSIKVVDGVVVIKF